MKSLLVASDLSSRGDRAIERAAQLAAASGAALVIVHVIDGDLPEEAAKALTKKAQSWLATTAERAGAHARIMVRAGDASHDIHALADEIGAGLVVLGTHRSRPLMDLFRETTVERLVRMGRQPTLIVRDPVGGPYGSILLAMDFSPAAARAGALARQISPGARLHGFHAIHVPFQGITDIHGHATDIGFQVREAEAELAAWGRGADPDVAEATEVEAGALHEVLERQVARHAPDLLALGAHGRSGKAPFLLGSFANDLMRNAPCDVLIARG